MSPLNASPIKEDLQLVGMHLSFGPQPLKEKRVSEDLMSMCMFSDCTLFSANTKDYNLNVDVSHLKTMDCLLSSTPEEASQDAIKTFKKLEKMSVD